MDSEEFLQAYDQLADAIFRHCFFRVYDREEAKDLVQETFIRGWGYIAKGKEVQNLKALLYKIANNLIIDGSRRKKTASLDELREHGFDPGEDKQDELEARIAAREVMPILQGIEPAYRQVVVMRYIDDMPPAEIASVLNESENAVSVRLHRAVKKLRTLAGDKGMATMDLKMQNSKIKI